MQSESTVGFKPGLHIIAKLKNCNQTYLIDYSFLRRIVDTFIMKNGLSKLGEVYHRFENAGFTGVVCLSESHVSFHTWPEYDIINLDIYLSNHLKDNKNIVQNFFQTIVDSLEAVVAEKQEITR
jgi:S-adenosylmethionine decarboxylase